MTAALGVMARALVPGAHVAVLMADSVVLATPVYAIDLLQRASAEAGLVVTATASQLRPHFHGPSRHAFAKRARREHLVLLTAR